MNLQLKDFFENLDTFLTDNVLPIACQLDHDSALLHDRYQALVNLGCLRFMVPFDQGGMGAGRQEWIEYNIKMAQCSGALLFLQAQHQFAVSQLNKCIPSKSIFATLENIAKNTEGLGIAIAANRKILDVKMIKDGFSISGTLLWVTGHHFFDKIFFSFDYQNRIYYSLLPFKPVENSLIISKNRETIVFSSTNSVSINLTDYIISNTEIIHTEPFRIKTPAEHPAIYNFLGAAKALLKTSVNEKYHNHPEAIRIYEKLHDEWQQYYNKIIQGSYAPFIARAEGLKLAERCLSFAKMTSGSKGLLSSHPIARLSREIWQYSIAGYSKDQFEAYLKSMNEVIDEIS